MSSVFDWPSGQMKQAAFVLIHQCEDCSSGSVVLVDLNAQLRIWRILLRWGVTLPWNLHTCDGSSRFLGLAT